jgi:hypothetical protein
MADVVDGKQLTMFGILIPECRPPTAEETHAVVPAKVRIVIFKFHRGRPPQGMTFEDLHQEVALRTLHRLRHFRHGGKFTLGEYAYVAACYALCDIQRQDMARSRRNPRDYPLLEILAPPALEA